MVRRIEELDYEPRVSVHYFGNEAESRAMAETLQQHLSDDVLVTPVPSVMAAHTGLGVIAVVVGPPTPHLG